MYATRGMRLIPAHKPRRSSRRSATYHTAEQKKTKTAKLVRMRPGSVVDYNNEMPNGSRPPDNRPAICVCRSNLLTLGTRVDSRIHGHPWMPTTNSVKQGLSIGFKPRRN